MCGSGGLAAQGRVVVGLRGAPQGAQLPPRLQQVGPLWCHALRRAGPEGLRRPRALDAASPARGPRVPEAGGRSEEHTSELQSLMRISYAVFCLKKKRINSTARRTSA